MAKIHFYENADVYSDGDIENEILRLANEGFDITKSDENYPYAVAYHFSPQRENILSWYPFKKDSSCLEIGAGCGAITGMLCQKCHSVVSVDISKRRCQINYARHKDIDELEIIAGNIQTLDLNRKFDYVVLNGVFEYALSFVHTDTPYKTLMQLAKSFLKDDGKLFIAIENRIGLKYFNGGAEDHTDTYFSGLNQYDDNNSVRTFSKRELISIINEAGFKNYRFYYPYPDYKFASEIFTDATINGGEYGAPYMNLNKHNFGLFSEKKVSETLAKEGVMDKFSNSFLVEISNVQCDSTIDYVKINSLRKAEYGIMTLLSKSMNSAIKLPLSKRASEHILNMHENINIYPEGIRGLDGEKFKNGLKYPFLKYKNLAEIINESNDKKPVSSALKSFFNKFKPQNKYFNNDSFKTVFGNFPYNNELMCINHANVDLICDNIFIDENGAYIVIDNEWVFDFDVPLQFIVWRNVNELYFKNPNLEQKEPKQSVFDDFGINVKMCEVFYNWAVYFANKYVGCNYLSKYVQPLKEISLLELYNAEQSKKEFYTSCYYDRGNGFDELDKEFSTIELDEKGNFSVEFKIPDDVVNLRWDIAEGVFLECFVESVEGGRLVADNASEKREHFDVFYTIDPHYTILDFCNKVVIKGKIKWIDRDETLHIFEKNIHLVAQQQENINEMQRSATLDFRYILDCERRIRSYFDKQVELNNIVEAYKNEINIYKAEKKRIENSKAWRIMSIIWRLRARLMNRGR